MKDQFRALLLIILLAVPGLVGAVPLTFFLGGQLPETGSPATSGMPWLAYLTIDDVPASSRVDGSQVYRADSPGFGLVLSVAGTTRVSETLQIIVGNNARTAWGLMDYVWLRATGGSTLDTAFGLDMFWADVAGNDDESQVDAIDSDELFPSPRGFQTYCFELCHLQVGDILSDSAYFSMDNLFVVRSPFVIPVSVAEPRSAIVLGLALIILIATPKQRSSSRRSQFV